jgi:membrane protease YdiL (CAAX protease family)
LILVPSSDPLDPPSDAGEGLRPGQLYKLAWAFYLALALGAIVWLGVREGTISLALFVRWPSALQDVALGLGVGGSLIGVWMIARRRLASARRLEDELRDILGEIDTGEVLALALLSGLAEELFFRGAVQGAFGWLVATVLFTLLHTGPGAGFRLWTLFAGVAGLAFAGLVAWRQTLLPAIVAHVVVNAVNLHYLVKDSPNSGETAGAEEGLDL